MVASAIATADEPKLLDIFLAADEDDKCFNLYRTPDLVQRFATGISDIYNALAGKAMGDILMATADDVLFRTQGWDTKVRAVAARFPDGLFIAAPNNGDGKRRVNHWFTGWQWIRLFGWMVPPHFEHFCPDEWVQEVAAASNRLVYMDDVLIEHMHKKYGKSPNDDTYQRKRNPDPRGSMSDRDIATFRRLAPLLAEDKAILKQCVST